MKILLVDDNELIQVRLSRSIKKLYDDCIIHKAADCEEALSIFVKINPDLVILDISLPDGSGIDLLRTMKKENPNVTIFMFTNYGTEEFKKSCIELGADGFLEKSNFNGLMHCIDLLHKNLINQ